MAVWTILSTGSAGAADIQWQGGSESYTHAAAWVGGVVPGPSDSPINSNGTNNVVQIRVGDPDWTVNDLSAAGDPNATGAIEQFGQTVTATGWFHVGSGSNSIGIYTLDGGTLNVPSGALFLGEGPGSTSVLNLNGGTLNKGNVNGNPFYIGVGNWNGNLARTGTVNQVNGTVNSASEIWVGQALQGTGLYNLHHGVINSTNWFVVGRQSGEGVLNMDGGVINQYSGGQPAFIVSDTVGSGFSTGTFNFSGGTVNCLNAEFWLANQSGSVATANMSGTAVLNANNWIAIGRGGNATLNLSGGTIVKTGNGNLVLGASSGDSVGTINQTGGAVTNTSSQTWIGESGTGTWNLEDGVAILGQVNICQNGGATGTLNLHGGLLQATGINSGNSVATSTLIFDGGTLQAGTNNDNFLSGIMQAMVNSGGARIDSQGYNVTIAQTLLGNGGGLTKSGSGTLTLSGANSYTGPTLVNGGTVLTTTASGASGDYTLANGTGFRLQVAAAGGQFNAANFSFTGATATLSLDLGNYGNPTAAPLNVSGTLTVNGTVTLNVQDTLPTAGQIPLVKYGAWAGSGKFVLGSLSGGMVAYLSNNVANSSVDLVVTSAGAPRWDGAVAGGVWDINNTPNWFDLGTQTTSTYHDGTPVLFDDNATGTTTVNLTTTVNPASLTVANNSLSYTWAGAGKIAGPIGLTKQGAGSLAVLNTGGNSYTGPTLINGGTLVVTNLANGGAPSPLGASSADPTNLVIGSATFTYAGAPVSANRGFTIGATNSTLDAEGNLTLGGRVVAAANVTAGGSSFTKVGPAQLALTGSGVTEFANLVNPGLRVANGTLLLDGSAGGQTNHTVNELWVGSTDGTGGTLVLSNTTLNVDSWLGLGRSSALNTTSTVALYNAAFSIGNCSLGYAAGVSGYQGTQILALSGTSTLTNHGDLNLGESSGANVTVTLKDNAVLWSQNRGLLSMVNNAPARMTLANNARVIINSGWFSVADGGGSAALVLQDNASFSNAGDFNVTDNGAATATVLVQDNARLTANNFFVGKDNNATAVLTITNNATVLSYNGLTMAHHWNGDAVVPAEAVVNLAGGSLAVNLVQGRNNVGTFNFNGGRLIARLPFAANFMFNLGAINVQAGGAIIDSDTNAIAITQPLLGAGGNGGLTKLGTGTLYLNGANTYTGPTVVSVGALGGSGSLLGPVTVASGAKLLAAPGAIGTFTINNSLTLSAGSTTYLKLDAASNDQIAGLTAVSYGGALVLTNAGGTSLTTGSVYKLFSASTMGTGNFASVTILPSGAGTFNPATGELTLTSNAGPFFNPPSVSGGNVVLSGTGGTPNAGYTVLTSTNVAAPLAAWTTNATGTFTSSGAFTNAIPINSAEPARFFRVRMP